MKILTEIEAVQWRGEGHPLPDGAVLCQPEVHYSADREHVYFTYADLRCRHWIDAGERAMPPPDKFEWCVSGITTRLTEDGVEREYWRRVFPFSVWSIKSEASVKGDHRAVYLDPDDRALLRAFLDYCDLEKWGELKDGHRALPPRAEYRITDGGYGRGFKPVYLQPGSWLVKEPGREPYALSDEEFAKRLPSAAA